MSRYNQPRKSLKYSMAICLMRNNFMNISIFDKSSILAELYNLPKEKTIEHLRTGYCGA
jgi:hypothetical protein